MMQLRYDFINKFDGMSLQRPGQERRTNALIVVRFNNLNEIITFFGFKAGDEFLNYVERCFKSILREEDVMAKVGDSEYGIFLPNLHNQAHAILAVNKIVQEFNTPFSYNDVSIDARTAIGVVIPKGDCDGAKLMQNAYQALLQAEKNRRSFALYELAPDDSLPPDLVIENEITRALNNDEFVLFYQPKFHLLSRENIAAEALIRWVSPKLGSVNTQYFIDVLEKSSALMPVTKWVINQAISHLVKCQKIKKNYSIAVNLSSALFTNHDIVDVVLNAVNIWSIDPKTLIVEVTETAMMENPSLSLEILRAISDAGVKVSIDDFGTGYSSLSYLKDLPADELKIDMSFVKDMHESPRNRSIATSTTQLAHNLGLSVTAEGIENEEIMDLLIKMGCDTGQGYHLDRPMPFEEFLEKLT